MKVALVWVTFVAATMLAARQQVFRATTDAVRVDVLVTDGRRPVGGLKIDDFELLDEHVPQKIQDVQIAEVPFSMMLALDTSTSVEGAEFAQLKAGATAAIGLLRSDDRATVITFGEQITQLRAWGTSTKQVTYAVAQVQVSGATSLYDAAFAALFQRDPSPGRRGLVIIFTDGDDTSSWMPADAALDLANRSDAVVYAVVTRGRVHSRGLQYRSGIRLTRDQPVIHSADFLEELTRRTNGNLLIADGPDLPRAFEHILSDFRSRYVLSYVPNRVSGAGWHRIEVRLKGRSGRVTARRGYQR